MTGILVTNKGSKEETCELPQPLEVSSVGKAHNLKNRSGETFNGIHILYPVERSNDGHIKYLMQCHCGKYFITTAKNIVNGNTKSCGCRKIKSVIDRNHSKTENLIGQTIGYLKVLEFSHYENDNSCARNAVYKCLCTNCNSICYRKGYRLNSKQNLSCGCMNSYKELEISQLLDNANIQYQKQYSFEDLISPVSNYKLRFDFAIFKNNQLQCLIEYQGKQHYEEDNPWYSEEGKLRDKAKRDYCKIHNIPLIELDKSSDINACIISIQEGDYHNWIS